MVLLVILGGFGWFRVLVTTGGELVSGRKKLTFHIPFRPHIGLKNYFFLIPTCYYTRAQNKQKVEVSL